MIRKTVIFNVHLSCATVVVKRRSTNEMHEPVGRMLLRPSLIKEGCDFLREICVLKVGDNEVTITN
jgi:hypothetical protein